MCLQKETKRDAITLYNILSNNVTKGSILYSDCWRSYLKVNEEYAGKFVNHKFNFIDIIDPKIYTNNIKRL